MQQIKLTVIGSDRFSEFIHAWEDAFSRKLDTQIYNWIFDGKNIMYAAMLDGDIAAGYCLYPFEAIWQGEKKTALLCNNVFVVPKHQGKHLFVKLGKLALDEAGRKGHGHVAYGIPNKLALPGHKRVGWGTQPPIRFFAKQRAEAPRFLPDNWQKGTLSQIKKDDIERCSRESSKNRSFSIIKTAQFVHWRFESKPGTHYWFGFKYRGSTLLAYCVCKFYEPGNVLHFIDIDGIDSNSISQLAMEAEHIPETFEKLNIWGSTAKIKVFENLGYCPSDVEDNLIFINPKSMMPLHLSGDFNISLADNDVY